MAAHIVCQRRHIGPHIRVGGALVVVHGISERIVHAGVGIGHPDPGVVQADRPAGYGHAALAGGVEQLVPEQGMLLSKAPHFGLDAQAAEAGEIGIVIQHAILGEVDLAAGAAYAQKASGMVAGDHAHAGEAVGLHIVQGGADAAICQVPRIRPHGSIHK